MTAAARARPEIIGEPVAMAAWSEASRGRGQRIAFVPTMGYLHEGHLSLLREGRRRAGPDGRLVLSIFVNPTQFAPTEDLARYPRDPDGDLAKAAATGCDAVFLPDAAAMYPPGHQTVVRVRQLEKGLCGDRRPEHFAGVATVVCKLFNLVRPHVALFGEKDFQQLAVIRRMVRDLDMPVEVSGLPIVREADGLAMSSRNKYLSADERRSAQALSRGLARAGALFEAGERRAATLIEAARATIAPEANTVDYVELRDAETLAPLSGELARPAVLAVAAFVGATRLIDNLRLG